VHEEKIAITGWTESTDLDIMTFIENYKEKGIRKVISTDISKDGMLQGVSIELYKKILSEHQDLYLIASGGVSQMQDIIDLEKEKIPAVIVGKAIYEGKITLKEISKYISTNQ